MKILTISQQYPSTFSVGPMMIFHRHIAGLVKAGCIQNVICPVPDAFFPLPYFSKKWRAMSRIPATMVWDGAYVSYPRYVEFPHRFFYSSAGHRMFLGIRRITDMIYKNDGFEIIHCHTCYPDGFAGLLAKKRYRLPLVITVHGSDLREINDVGRAVRLRIMEALQGADAVVSPHPEMTGILQKLGITAIAEIHNGIDVEKFRKRSGGRQIINEFGMEGKTVISFIANLKDIKDPETFVRAAPLIIKKVPDAILLVVGDGNLKGKCMAVARELGVASKVIFTGVRSDIASILAATDVFAALSPYDNIWSTNILEAMSARVPCIVTAAGDTPKYMPHKKVAYLVSPKDPMAVGTAVAEILDDRRLRETIVANAFSLVENEFDIRAVARQTIELYSRLLVASGNHK